MSASGLYLTQSTESGPARALRAGYHSARVVLEYSRRDRTAPTDALHARAAARLLHVCRLHGGIYNKFGQYVASMAGSGALPAAYAALSACEARQFPKLAGIKRDAFAVSAYPYSMYEDFPPPPLPAAWPVEVPRNT